MSRKKKDNGGNTPVLPYEELDDKRKDLVLRECELAAVRMVRDVIKLADAFDVNRRDLIGLTHGYVYGFIKELIVEGNVGEVSTVLLDADIESGRLSKAIDKDIIDARAAGMIGWLYVLMERKGIWRMGERPGGWRDHGWG